MNIRKAEDGYVLLIVLLLITFIMVMATVFISSSLSNAKQEQVVDEDHLSVVAAEMGVDYYKAFYINRYNAAKQKIIDFEVAQLKIRIENFQKDKKQFSLESEIQKTRIKIATKIKDQLEVEPPLIVSLNELNAGFRLADSNKILISIKEEENEIYVQAEVKEITGHYKDDQTNDLDMLLTFHIPAITFELPELGQDGENPEKPGAPGGSGQEKKPIFKKDHEYVTGTKSFTNKDIVIGGQMVVKGILTLKDSILDVGEELVIEDEKVGNGNFINSGINITGQMIVNKNLTVNGSILDVGGQLVIKGVGSFTNSEIDIEGEMVVKGDLSLSDGSNIVISKQLVADKLTLNDSTIYVGEEFQGGESIANLNNRSMMCIAGQIDLSLVEIDDTSTLYTTKKIIEQSPHPNKNPTRVVEVQEKQLKILCAARANTGGVGSPTIGASDTITIDVTY